MSVNGIVPPDSALDSEDGIYYKAGNVIIDGAEQSYNEGDVFNETGMNGPMGANGNQNPPDKPDGQPMGGMPMGGAPADFDIAEFKEKVAALSDDASFEDVMALLGGNMGMPGGQIPEEVPSR